MTFISYLLSHLLEESPTMTEFYVFVWILFTLLIIEMNIARKKGKKQKQKQQQLKRFPKVSQKHCKVQIISTARESVFTVSLARPFNSAFGETKPRSGSLKCSARTLSEKVRLVLITSF